MSDVAIGVARYLHCRPSPVSGLLVEARAPKLYWYVSFERLYHRGELIVLVKKGTVPLKKKIAYVPLCRDQVGRSSILTWLAVVYL